MIGRGDRPGGSARHVPVLLKEACEALGAARGGAFVDGTFGAGGYTQAILRANPVNRVVAIDRDPEVIGAGAALAAKFKRRLTLVSGRFGALVDILREAGHETVDGVVLDIGVSSMQLDQPERGFSFRANGPLDMRMERMGVSAADLVNEASEAELADIFHFYGEERRARAVARAIVERRRTFEVWRANPIGSLIALRRFPMMFGLIGVGVLLQLAHDALPATWTYYTMLKFNWTSADVGYSLMAVGALTAVSFGVLPPLVVPRIGETNAVYLGLAFSTLGYAGYAFSAAPWMLYTWMVVWSLGGIGGPALNSIMSAQVPADEQGELMGARASMDSITSIIAPVVMTGLFSYFTSSAAPIYFAGASFLAAALCELGALGLFARTKPHAALAPAE